MKKYRIIQLLTGFHRIHSIRHGFGWKLPFFEIAYFPKKRQFKKLGFVSTCFGEPISEYHNSTQTDCY